jgi:hypothetical protein
MEANMGYNLKNYDIWKYDYPDDPPEDEHEFDNDGPDYDPMVVYDMVNSNRGMNKEYGYEY